ncbi:MAG: DUF5018 domain-containing protein [Cyclobacteriaceae bacterium]
MIPSTLAKSKFGCILIILLLTTFFIYGQINVPDTNFRSILSSDYGITFDANNDISNSSATKSITALVLGGQAISDLSGIEAFTSLTDLRCFNNTISLLDLSENTALEYLDCSGNQLTSLIISPESPITYLHCKVNQLTVLDVSSNTMLKDLNCFNNQLTSLDVSNNTELEHLQASGNRIPIILTDGTIANIWGYDEHTQLAIKRSTDQNPTIFSEETGAYVLGSTGAIVNITTNQSSASNISSNIGTSPVTTGTLPSGTLDIISDKYWIIDNQEFSGLYNLILDLSNINELLDFNSTKVLQRSGEGSGWEDVSMIPGVSIQYLEPYVIVNNLTSFSDFAIGNFDVASTDFISFELSEQIQLAEIDLENHTIEVEVPFGTDVSFLVPSFILSSGSAKIGDIEQESGITAHDFTTSVIYSVTAEDEITTETWTVTVTAPLKVHDANFRTVLSSDYGITFDVDNNITNTATAAALTSMTITSQNISDLTGIEGFSALKELNCRDNQLVSFDISSNTALTALNFESNQLTGMDLSTNTLLTTLRCADNQLSNLDVSSNMHLTLLECYNNQLTSITLSSNPDLTFLDIGENQLSELDISTNTKLTWLSFANNQIDILDISSNVALEILGANDNSLDNLNVSANTSLVQIAAFNNNLASIDVSTNTALLYLQLENNILTGIDVSLNTLLKTLALSNNETLTGSVPDYIKSLPLDYFTFDGTNLCEPADAAYQAWKEGLTTYSPSELICLNTDTDITSFGIAEQTEEVSPDAAKHTVDVKMAFGTDRTQLMANFTLSQGASAIANAATDDLLAWYPFNGNADDASGNGYNGTVVGATLGQDRFGKTNSAFYFSDNEIQVPTLSGTSLSISVWINPSFLGTGSATQTIINSRDQGTADFLGDGNWELIVEDSEIEFGLWDSSGKTYLRTNTSPLKINEWQHIIAEYNNESGEWKISYNGSTIATRNFHIDINQHSSYPVLIGRTFSGTSTDHFQGAIDDLIIYNLGNIFQESGVSSNDFSNPLTYTIIAEDGTTTQDWLVTVTAPNTEADITTFSLTEQTVAVTPNSATYTIDIEVDYGTALTALTPTMTLSPNASIVPNSATTQDFSNPVTYTVTAEDGTTTQNWTVTVTIAPNTETDIISFILAEQTAAVIPDPTAHTVDIELVYGTDLTSLTPTITLSPNASISPNSATAQDFTRPVTYTVTAEDGISTQDWVVTVTIAPNTETDIVEFSLSEQTTAATINFTDHTIDLEVEYKTDLAVLIPTYILSEGANALVGSNSQVSSITSNDFTSPVTYTVTAEDGVTSQDWVVSVVEETILGLNGLPNELVIYPNPTTSELIIEYSNMSGQISILSITNLSGKLMERIQVEKSKELRIDAKDYPSGLYMIQIQNDQIKSYSKFIKK